MKKFLITVTTIALTSLGVFSLNLPAQAHSDEVSSSPADGATVEAGEIPIELTFGEPLMVMDDDSVGHEIVITDSEGIVVPMSACAGASDTTLSATAMIQTAGSYEAYWRTVSEDGHPVEGNFKFTVTNTSGYEVDQAKQIVCEESVGVHEHEEAIESEEGSNVLVNVVGGIAALAVAGVIVAISRGRRRK